MESIDAVYGYLGKQPWANMNKILLSGSSRGGILSVVYAAERHGSAIGVLNFVDGWMSDSCNLRAETDINAIIFKVDSRRRRIPSEAGCLETVIRDQLGAEPGGQPGAPIHGFYLARVHAAHRLPYSLGRNIIDKTISIMIS